MPVHTRLAALFAGLPLLLELNGTGGNQEVPGEDDGLGMGPGPGSGSGSAGLGKLVQCLSVIGAVLSDDEQQMKMDVLGRAVLFRRGRGRGDRRGFVGARH